MRPWDLSLDHTFRAEFRDLQNHFLAPPKIHPSLEAHYERVQNAGVEALFRFLQEDVAMTSEKLGQDMAAVRAALTELAALNKRAWVRDAEAVDVKDSLEVVLADARKSFL